MSSLLTCSLAHRLRPFVEGDRAFVAHGWASEMRHSAFSRYVTPEVYWPCQHELVKQLLDSPDCRTIVACDPDDAGHLYGSITFLPADAAIVHWLYVKGDYRRLGLASELVTAAVGDKRPILATQAPAIFNDRSLVERQDVLYCPYLLLGIAPQLPARAPSGVDMCQTSQPVPV